jgi:vacuolar protein sorting-associated protein 13A/C
VSLSTLAFYCNRPTVIAALDLVTAITAQVQPKKDEESTPTGADGEGDAQSSSEKESNDASGPSDINSKDNNGRGQEADKKDGDDKEDPQSTTTSAEGAMTTINPKVVEDVDEQGNPKIAPKKKDSVVKGLLGKRKDRVVFLLVLDMERAEIVLNMEDGSSLSTLSQDNFHTDVKVTLDFRLFGINICGLSKLSFTDFPIPG